MLKEKEPLTELQFASSMPRLICVKAIIALGFIIHAQGRAALAEHQHLLLNNPGVCTCICSTWTNSKHVRVCVSEVVACSRIKFTIFTVEYFIVFSLFMIFCFFCKVCLFLLDAFQSFWGSNLWFFCFDSLQAIPAGYFQINMIKHLNNTLTRKITFSCFRFWSLFNRPLQHPSCVMVVKHILMFKCNFVSIKSNATVCKSQNISFSKEHLIFFLNNV